MTRPLLAWALAVFCLGCAVVDTLVTAAARPLFSEESVAQHGWPLATAATVAAAAMGALIVSRYPGHPVGWLLTATGVSGATSLVTEGWSIWVLHADGPGSRATGHLLGWLSMLDGAVLAIGFLAFIFLVAPDGRLLSPRWRWAGVVVAAGVALFTAGVLAVPPGDVVVDESQDFGPLAGLLMFGGLMLVAGGLVAAATSLVRRLRRAQGALRQQLRWVAASAATLAFGLTWLLVVQAVRGGEQSWLDSLPLFLSYLLFPVAVGFAVLRHRLYDIDLVLSRAALLTVATAFVAAGYVALVVGVGGNAGGFWPSLLATAVVAVAFQPLRARVVRWADRLAYGPRAAPYEALAELSRRLGDSPEPSTLLPAITDTAARAVDAVRVVVRLHAPGAPERDPTVATLPDPPDEQDHRPVVRVPLVDGDDVLGHIELELAAGRSLREADLTLLRDVADQAAMALRQARLSAELSRQVEALRSRTTDLQESRGRLVTVGDAERRRLERAIASDVVPHLAALPDALERLAGTGPGDAADLAPLVAAATSALEALREITRGVFPTQLARGGLGPALASYLGRTASAGRLELDPSAARRFDARVEAAAYFCVAEAAQSLQTPLDVTVATSGQDLVLRVAGGGGTVLALAHVRDRVEAAGGTVSQEPAGGRTVLAVRLPLGDGERPAAGADLVAVRS